MRVGTSCVPRIRHRRRHRRNARAVFGIAVLLMAIARALIGNPEILFADEPTGNLDSKTGMDVIALLKMTSQAFHQTIVMITHNEEIALMADRMVRIEDGKVVNGDAAK